MIRPKSVSIFEVGPRDGLQNEPTPVGLGLKFEFIKRLVECGAKDIEVGAFVRADRVPQMADSEELVGEIKRQIKKKGTRFWYLVPNEKGLERAMEFGVKNIAVFTSSTDGFNQANLGMPVKESLRVLKKVVATARAAGIQTRGYVSTAFGCPFEGAVGPRKPIQVVESLLEMGVFQVSVGDTIGVASPKGVEQVFGSLLKSTPAQKLAGHFHDTRGTALVNAITAIRLGVQTLDSSAGGLGGCPFAPGATGNLATEDLVYCLEDMGIRTGIHLDDLSATSVWMAGKMNLPLKSRYLAANVKSKPKKKASR